jgi:adenylosuccinate synthase
MKKMYRGGDNGEKKGEGELPSEEQKENQDQDQEQKQETKQNGGRRRRKGKIHKGKSRKGKVSKWITHVKNFSRANKMDFRDALKDPKCKASYHKMK